MINPYRFVEEKEDAVKEALLLYGEYTLNFKSSISFAWDNPTETNHLLKAIKESTKKTQYLVVIGYSFPFFNRRIDYEIIRNMKDLRKIYVQDPNADEIMDRVKAIKTEYQDPLQSSRLIAIKNTKQFYLPDELT